MKSHIYDLYNKTLLNDYNHDIEDTMKAMVSIDEMIASNIGLLDALCPYLQDIFLWDVLAGWIRKHRRI